MRSLLRYTLDLFEPAALVEPARVAPKNIAFVGPKQPHQPGQLLSLAIAPTAFAHPRANRNLQVGDAVVAYLFERAKRRTIGFVVGPDGLTVRAPRWTPIPEVEAALLEKAAWITRKLSETRERQARQSSARIEWREGAVLPFLGVKIAVELDPGHGFAAVGAQLEPAKAGGEMQVLRVGLPHAAAPEQIRDAVQAWLMHQAKSHFTQRLDHFAPLVQVRWQQLRLSNANTRWGSARTDGSIRLNWRLVHFSPAVIDYVVVHELSHLRVMNHSPRFWDAVGAVVPNYASLRKQLKEDTIPKW